MEEIISALSSGAGIGSGAIAGAIIIIKFIQNSFREMSLEFKEMSDKLDTVIKNYEVTKVKTEIELDHIKLRLLEIERRIVKLEESHGN